MAQELVAAFGDGVLGGQEERLVVGGPRQGSDALGGIGERLTGAQILHLQTVLAEAGVVDGVGEQIVVVADHEAAEADELAVLAESVEVEQNFLRGFHTALAPALDGVLLAFLGARVVEEFAAAGGHREIGLLDVPQHLLIDGVAEGFQVAGHGLGVGVFRLQVLHHLRTRLLAQPKVGVDHSGPMPRFAVFDAGRGGWSLSLVEFGNAWKWSKAVRARDTAVA